MFSHFRHESVNFNGVYPFEGNHRFSMQIQLFFFSRGVCKEFERGYASKRGGYIDRIRLEQSLYATQSSCPFKPIAVGEGGVEKHIQEIRSCLRRCIHPDLAMPSLKSVFLS